MEAISLKTPNPSEFLVSFVGGGGGGSFVSVCVWGGGGGGGVWIFSGMTHLI